jgi:hypothetical protein
VITRRRFLAVGLAGAAGLAAAGWLTRARQPARDRQVLDDDAEAIITAIVPVVLADALPDAQPERAQALAETIANVDAAIAGLPAHARGEVAQLFVILSLAPTRVAFAGLASSWHNATPESIDAMLTRLRESRIALRRAAYDALHQLVLAAWYANPRAWSSVGYAGPPEIG